MTRVLVVNPGSSSLKLAVVRGGAAVSRRSVDRWAGDPAPLGEFADPEHVDAVAVRVVHGGDRRGPAVLTDEVLAELDALAPLAPLHQPLGVALARHAAQLFPGRPVVGCFDTAFHASMPPRRRLYPLRSDLAARYGIVRHGYHGLSISYAVHRAAELLDADLRALRMVVCHVGSGVSITAVRDGSSVDTSMGFSPLDGAPGATRSGSLDPAIVFHLLRVSGMRPRQLESLLLRESGLAGMSGTDGDMRSVLDARRAGSVRAADAVDVYLHRIRQEIAAMRVSLDRLDALVLTGGVVEHEPGLRAELLAGLTTMGVVATDAAAALTHDAVLSPADARIAVVAVTAREDLEMARQTCTLVDQDAVVAR